MRHNETARLNTWMRKKGGAILVLLIFLFNEYCKSLAIGSVAGLIVPGSMSTWHASSRFPNQTENRYHTQTHTHILSLSLVGLPNKARRKSSS